MEPAFAVGFMVGRSAPAEAGDKEKNIFRFRAAQEKIAGCESSLQLSLLERGRASGVFSLHFPGNPGCGGLLDDFLKRFRHR
jgi:hypothetical protein